MSYISLYQAFRFNHDNPLARCAVMLALGASVSPATLDIFASSAFAEKYVTGTQVHATDGLCLDSNVSGNVYFNQCNGGNFQNWLFVKNHQLSTFQVQNRQTGGCLGFTIYGNVIVGACADSAGYYSVDWQSSGDSLVNTLQGLCLDGNSISVYSGPCNGRDYQKWKNQGKWPNYTILVHGYASPASKTSASQGQGNPRDYWYWQGPFSQGPGNYDVIADLKAAANHDGAVNYDVLAANWDGVSTIENSVHYLVDLLNNYCINGNTCDLVGHSTGDAMIGYTMDKFPWYSWNIRTVFAAGGAGGGVEAARVSKYFDQSAPVVYELQPFNMRGLYNHNMSGIYANVPNIRFVGRGTNGSTNGYSYVSISIFSCLFNDGVVPWHSQAGVSAYSGCLPPIPPQIGRPGIGVPNIDCYGTPPIYNAGAGGCGAIYWGTLPAVRYLGGSFLGGAATTNIPLFNGYKVQVVDWGAYFNHTDEIGFMARWISQYKRSSPLPVAIVAPGILDSAGNLMCLDVNDGAVGRQAWLWGCNGTPAQIFMNDGSGRLFWVADTTKCLDVRTSDNANGTPVQIYSCNSTNAQGFDLGYEPGVIQWPAGVTGQRCMDISGASNQYGTPVQIYDCNGTVAQQWSIQQ